MTNSHNSLEIPRFYYYYGERNEKLPVIDGVVFHHNRAHNYRCKYNRTHGCKVRIKLLDENTFEYTNGDSNSHVDHPIDYYNIKQKELNKLAATLPENLLKSPMEIATEVYMKKVPKDSPHQRNR